MKLSQINKRNKEIMKRIVPILAKKYTVKEANELAILLKLDNSDDIEITTRSTAETPLSIYVWKDGQRTQDYFQGVSEDRLIPMIDDLIALYHVGYNGHTKSTAWYKI
jgi:hypothetical protein